MLSCAGFLEPRKSRLGTSKSTFNDDKYRMQLLHVYLNRYAVQFALEMCLAA